MRQADSRNHSCRRQGLDPLNLLLQQIPIHHYFCEQRSEGASARVEGDLGRKSAKYPNPSPNLWKVTLLLETETLYGCLWLHMRGREVARTFLSSACKRPFPREQNDRGLSEIDPAKAT